jgi:hypothetical protein
VSWLAPLLGAVLIGMVLVDVFLTVLMPASGHGPLRRPLSRVTWAVFLWVGRRLPRRRRRGLLTYSGPVLISGTIVVWVLLLLLGWALVYLPALGSGIVASKGDTTESLITALYVSGFTLTTLGTGDVVPVTGVYRILVVAESAVGFSVFTKVLTYFLTPYAAITRRRRFATELEHRTFDTGSAVRLLIGLWDPEELGATKQHLAGLAGNITEIAETHTSYPVLGYFHYRHNRYALPRILLILLEMAALIRSALAQERYAALRSSAALFQIEAACAQLLDQLETAGGDPPTSEVRGSWGSRFDACRSILADAGLEVTDSPEAGADCYVELRTGWDSRLRRLADRSGYDWDAIEVSQP